ncbi:hypothetical protein EDB92DRAFT_2055093 [Lactarius akahatsu]|uniref:Uncharacterized protein n=1 Tax=Lactarius akahatsu TaxID=416441 RepID=A0AAD4LAX5_9AGAM|nr:hypothetical protein EDB92DRAFT_2055093 [Lactarius akahatsu]
MANLNRSAKSSRDWIKYDLRAFNIQIQLEDKITFFGDPNLPLPVIDEEILTTLKGKDMLSDHNAELIHLLDRAKQPVAGGSAVDDFTVELLRQLGYVKRNRVAHTQMDIPLHICQEQKHAKTLICLLDHLTNDICLLIQEDELRSPLETLPQLIAEAIAAVDFNNRLQVTLRGEAVIESKACDSLNFIMPGIIQTGTMPTFCKIPVTNDLLRNVWFGTYPSEPTIVSVHIPDLPSPHHRYVKGMEPLDNRQAVLCCYEAFKHIVGI